MQCNAIENTKKSTAPTLFCVVFVVVGVVGAALDTTITVMHLLLLLYNAHVIIIFFPVYFFHCMYGAYGIHTTKGHFYLSYAFSEHRFPSILCLFCVFLLLFFFVRLANGKLPCSWQFVMMMIWWWRTWYEANEDMNSRKWIECVQNNKIQTNRKKSSGMNIK